MQQDEVKNIDLKNDDTQNNQNLQKQKNYMDCNQIVFKNFAIRASDQFLGISILNQKMYVVQKRAISVFEYFLKSKVSNQNQYIESFTNHKLPTLSKQIFLPFEISKYFITEKYICIKSKNKTEIRDIEFEKVYYSENKGIMTAVKLNCDRQQAQSTLNRSNCQKSAEKPFDTAEQLQLEFEIVNDDMISWKVVVKRNQSQFQTQNNDSKQSKQLKDQKYIRTYISERINILTKHKSIIKFRSQIIDPTNKSKKYEICKPPIFINQVGYIQNFYIWPCSSADLQLGIFFNHKQHGKVTENALYELCNFQLRENFILKQVYYYESKDSSTNKDERSGVFFAICQNTAQQKSKLKIMIFEMLPDQKLVRSETQNQALNNYLDQFNILRGQKKLQSSGHLLLNQLLTQKQQDNKAKDQQFVIKRPTNIIQSITLNNSGSYRKSFYNPHTKILWVDDNTQVVYRIKFLTPKLSSETFIENIEEYRNESSLPELEGAMYDIYPIYKHRALSLEIGLRGPMILTSKEAEQVEEHNDGQTKKEQDEKNIKVDKQQVIDLDDKQLQEIGKEKMRQVNDNSSKNNQQIEQIKRNPVSEKIKAQNITGVCAQKTKLVDAEIQTQMQQKKIHPSLPQENFFSLDKIPQLFQPLNFKKIQDVLIRFSSIFVSNINKNINKLKQTNNKAKQQIKTKINSDIFQLIKDVFQPLLSEELGVKIQKQLSKSRQFIQKLFNKQLQHFNTLVLQDNVKEQQIKKFILEQQINSINVIKQASMKFFDVTKIREMQKIAYNQIVVDSFRQVGEKIQSLQKQVDNLIEESEKVQKRIIVQIEQIKELFMKLNNIDNKEQEQDQVESGCQSDDESQGQESCESQQQDDEEVDSEQEDKGGIRNNDDEKDERNKRKIEEFQKKRDQSNRFGPPPSFYQMRQPPPPPSMRSQWGPYPGRNYPQVNFMSPQSPIYPAHNPPLNNYQSSFYPLNLPHFSTPPQLYHSQQHYNNRMMNFAYNQPQLNSNMSLPNRYQYGPYMPQYYQQQTPHFHHYQKKNFNQSNQVEKIKKSKEKQKKQKKSKIKKQV